MLLYVVGRARQKNRVFQFSRPRKSRFSAQNRVFRGSSRLQQLPHKISVQIHLTRAPEDQKSSKSYFFEDQVSGIRYRVSGPVGLSARLPGWGQLSPSPVGTCCPVAQLALPGWRPVVIHWPEGGSGRTGVLEGRTGGRMDGRKDGRTDGRTNGP